MLLIMWLADITPPKHMAQMMSQMVSIMPRMPRVATSASISGWPVERAVLPKTDVIRALKPVAKSRVSLWAICSRMWGWKMSMQIPATTDEMKRVMMVGSLTAIRIPVMRGTSNSQGERLNFWASVSAKRALWALSVWLIVSPATVKMMRVMTIDGTVVTSM